MIFLAKLIIFRLNLHLLIMTLNVSERKVPMHSCSIVIIVIVFLGNIFNKKLIFPPIYMHKKRLHQDLINLSGL
jgi:hypothetical protein